MCVPYSFVITAKGEILDGKNLDHHTDICQKHGVEYDKVLKPEYQIWNRKLVDLEPSMEFMPKAFSKDGMLRDKFYSIANEHVDKKFTDWKSGLEYFEENWGVVKKYVPKLVTNTHGLIDFDDRDHLFLRHLSDRSWFRQWVSVAQEQPGFGDYVQYRLEFKPRDWMDEYIAKVFTISATELMANHTGRWWSDKELAEFVAIEQQTVRQLDQRIEWYISQFHYEVIEQFKQGIYKLSGSGSLTFEDFVKHWSKKENRVECWK